MVLPLLHLARRESRAPRVLAGAVSIALHVCVLVLLIASSGRYEGKDDGETPVTRLVLLASPRTDHRHGIALPPRELAAPTLDLQESLLAERSEPPPRFKAEFETEPEAANVALPSELTDTVDSIPTTIIPVPATIVVPPVDKSSFMQRLAHLAEDLVTKPQTHVTWEQDGRHYTATMTLERAKDGVELDRVTANVSAEHHGKQLTTRLNLKRLAFSNFTQVIDRWDPMVQLHDDEIVGRVHINSSFNLLHDRRVTPTFLGKVSTTAGKYDVESLGRSSDADMFRGGIETGARRIGLPDDVQPFAWAQRSTAARVHELANDTDIRFFPDGSYLWRDHDAHASQYRNEPQEQPVYFIGALGATVYVQGVVSGSVLIYSPRRIVVIGSLTYAHDPRRIPNSRDYLGLVSERFIEVAPPYVTGPGDIDIQAAIFAGRRFIITDIDHYRPATLRIYGSLAAGSMTASEPRYAMKVEYDSRFEEQRPPGFPSTNRFAAEDWDGNWTEASEQ